MIIIGEKIRREFQISTNVGIGIIVLMIFTGILLIFDLGFVKEVLWVESGIALVGIILMIVVPIVYKIDQKNREN